VAEDARDDIGLMDEGEDLKAAVAARANRDVKLALVESRLVNTKITAVLLWLVVGVRSAIKVIHAARKK